MSRWLLCAIGSLLVACAGETVFSGADLPEERRGELRAGSGVRILRIDDVEVDADRFALAPARYRVEIATRQSLDTAHSALEGAYEVGRCSFSLSVAEGESVQIVSGLELGRISYRGAGSRRAFWTEVRVESDREGSRPVSSTACGFDLDCRRMDLRRATPPPECDRSAR